MQKSCKFSLSEPHKNRGPKGQKSRLYQKYLSPEAKDILASDLHLEYDLYNFALRRLDQQLTSIQSADRLENEGLGDLQVRVRNWIKHEERPMDFTQG